MSESRPGRHVVRKPAGDNAPANRPEPKETAQIDIGELKKLIERSNEKPGETPAHDDDDVEIAIVTDED